MTLALTTNLPAYNVGQIVLARPTLTVNLAGNPCKLIRNVDGQSVTLTLSQVPAGEIPKDQVPEGEAIAIPFLVEACAGSALTLSANITLNGTEGYFVKPFTAGVKQLVAQYSTLGTKDPALDAEGGCVFTDPDDCVDILQVETLEATTTFLVRDVTSALAATTALCSYVDAHNRGPHDEEEPRRQVRGDQGQDRPQRHRGGLQRPEHLHQRGEQHSVEEQAHFRPGEYPARWTAPETKNTVPTTSRASWPARPEERRAR